jgi:hypothetical protein
MGCKGANCCVTMSLKNILEQQVPKGILERHECASMVWDHISTRLVLDATIIWDNMSARMM